LEISMKKIILSSLLIILPLIVVGCGNTHYVFKDAAPIQQLNDKTASAVPDKTDFDYAEYAVTSSARYPITNYFDVRRTPRSKDVNSMDETVASTWYTPRLGSQNLNGESLLQGPVNVGPPQTPITVVKTKEIGDTSGFIVEDKRGKRYLIKFDPIDFPGVQSTINLVVNRLFWGFGYNVPEDYIFYFKRNELSVDSSINENDVESVLFESETNDNGDYQATASLLIDGDILGPVSQKGTRKNDSNDTIPHEQLRALRALHVFSTWTDHSGMRSDNSLDTYVGNSGSGHTVHYLLDFGEALGAHGIGKGRDWDGFEHYFDLGDSIKKFVKLGLFVAPWENFDLDVGDPRGSFEAVGFDPATWKESLQFQPIQQSLPDDDYWAAKIVSHVSRDDLETLFDATNNSNSDYTQYLIDTLMVRKEKVLDYFLYQVSPVESNGVTNGQLQITDLGQKLSGSKNIQYEVNFYNQKNKKVGDKLTLENQGTDFSIPINSALQNTNGYLRVDVRVWKDGKKVPRSAEFHIRNNKLVGVIH